MLGLAYYPTVAVSRLEAIKIYRTTSRFVVCKIKGPRPRSPRVWKTNKRIGTISKSAKLVECIKGLSNVKEEVYGALDSFIAWELEFPLITVKKALKTLENQKDWKRIIQMTKWMLSKGQGRTMGSYFTLLNAFAEDGRLEEAEELWTKLFSENLESMPRIFFDKMVSIYYHRGMYENMFEIFADMEELSIRPSVSIVSMVGKAFQELGMLDKYKKLKKKYPPPKWEYRYIKGKRVKIERKDLNKLDDVDRGAGDVEKSDYSNESFEEVESNSVVHIVEPENVNQIENVEQAQLNESSEEVESNSVVHIVEPENVNQIENVEQAQLNESSEEVESNSVVHIVEPENVNQIEDIEQAQLNESSEEVESNSVVHIVKPENVNQIRGC